MADLNAAVTAIPCNGHTEHGSRRVGRRLACHRNNQQSRISIEIRSLIRKFSKLIGHCRGFLDAKAAVKYGSKN
jgi:hypothetical protein